MPQTCAGDSRAEGAPGSACCASGIATVVMPKPSALLVLTLVSPPLVGRGRGWGSREFAPVTRRCHFTEPPPSPTLPHKGGGSGDAAFAQPATCLMRAIISSTALSTGTFSLTTRFIALAQTFSLLRIVNL